MNPNTLPGDHFRVAGQCFDTLIMFVMSPVTLDCNTTVFKTTECCFGMHMHDQENATLYPTAVGRTIFVIRQTGS